MAARQSLRQVRAQRQSQRILAAPALQIGLRLLRLPLAELLDEIDHELGQNPFLVNRAPSAASMPGMGTQYGFDEIESRPSLVERLHVQIGMMSLAPRVRVIAEHLAGELRDDGYLETDLVTIAKMLKVSLADAEAGLAALQRCEPAGVGARTLSECLALQLEDAGVAAKLAPEVVANLESFVSGDWRRLVRKLDLPRAELERIAALVVPLSAHPVEKDEPALGIPLPDLIVERTPDGAWTLQSGRDPMPDLRLDTAYLDRAGASSFARACRSRAEALIGALAFRGETLRRIGAYLVEHQHRYFTEGPDYMRPLSRVNLADALGLHPSTVGRAVAGKAIEVDGRRHPLAKLFSSPVPQATGADLSAFVVRRRITRIIAGEDPAAPLSDEAIRTALASEGVDIARRTVAKYREWMRLPSSRQRRRSPRLRAAADGGASDARPG